MKEGEVKDRQGLSSKWILTSKSLKGAETGGDEKLIKRMVANNKNKRYPDLNNEH